ncbi:hypothetical protein FGO68_gene9546 [Halteria grandinella]|uniref:Uncharacterized protein n=1 Tax=Halteria grandinella TaxID=5974 RepID=A0A8J8SUU5_HALGN|nr:hypothetical protein FGO68_gene9546 [Halteria grandinella]
MILRSRAQLVIPYTQLHLRRRHHRFSALLSLSEYAILQRSVRTVLKVPCQTLNRLPKRSSTMQTNPSSVSFTLRGNKYSTITPALSPSLRVTIRSSLWGGITSFRFTHPTKPCREASMTDPAPGSPGPRGASEGLLMAVTTDTSSFDVFVNVTQIAVGELPEDTPSFEQEPSFAR